MKENAPTKRKRLDKRLDGKGVCVKVEPKALEAIWKFIKKVRSV